MSLSELRAISYRDLVALRASVGFSVWILSSMALACGPEVPGDDGAAGTGNVAGNLAGTGGAMSGSGGSVAGGLGGALSGAGGSAAGSAGSLAGTGGSLAGAGGSSGATSGAGGAPGDAGTSGNGGASAAGGAAGAGAGAGGLAGGSGSSGAGANAGAGTGGASGAAGAGGKGGGGGGGAGEGGFEPCPASGACKILPLGDSITDGIGFSGGYRVHLFELALAGDKEITFVGGSMNGPQAVGGQTFPRAHEGHSGWTIQQIDGIVPEPALNPSPHIVLLHIGTNDMYQGPNGAPDRLGALIDQIIAELPDALLVVSNIIPFPGQAGAVTTFNAAVPGVVNARKNAGKHILFVDQFAGFPTSELGDGVHPNEAGYDRMAAKWYDAIASYLP